MRTETQGISQVQIQFSNRMTRAIYYGVRLMLALAWIQMIVGMAAACMAASRMLLDDAAGMARFAIANDGPVPAAQQTGNMPQSKYSVHYNRVFMDWLYMNTNKLTMCTHMDMPEKSGMNFRNFMNTPFGADTEPQTEGVPGSPEQISATFKDITVQQLANYTNMSDLSFMTSISNDLEDYRRIMAYQLGLSIDDLVMYMFDYLRTYDTRTANQDSTIAPYSFTKNIIEQMPASLSGASVRPMKSGSYNGSIHPFFVGDLSLDNSNNSIVDIWKHTEVGQLKLEALTDPNADGEAPTDVLKLVGAHWRQSTNQTQTANWQGSGLTGVSTYCAGKDAVIFINFPNKRHTKTDPRWQNITCWAGEYQARTAFDPNGLIIGGTGYNCVIGVGLPPDTTSRARVAIAVPQTT